MPLVKGAVETNKTFNYPKLWHFTRKGGFGSVWTKPSKNNCSGLKFKNVNPEIICSKRPAIQIIKHIGNKESG